MSKLVHKSYGCFFFSKFSDHVLDSRIMCSIPFFIFLPALMMDNARELIIWKKITSIFLRRWFTRSQIQLLDWLQDTNVLKMWVKRLLSFVFMSFKQGNQGQGRGPHHEVRVVDSPLDGLWVMVRDRASVRARVGLGYKYYSSSRLEWKPQRDFENKKSSV